ncbi:hypothetical protein [Aureimonas populi]|uniref:UrcA family protein n=1 Tax=Aureimonas populi TaxID=1701758 RepID=A0ABW5CNR1_9HYPH|nr:hypothetical protein [Aureimonas populi]
MKTIILASALLAAAPSFALAQTPAEEPQATPTCAQALPQIVQLVEQAEAGGLEVGEARGHVGEAEAAQAAGDEGACIDALVLAQNTVLEQLPAGTPPSQG